jgi:7,8-dihydroneopterin 2',3'-cyclic phosphate phosphodiesterase
MSDERDHIKSLFPRINHIRDEGIREKVVNVCLKVWKMSDYERIEEQSAWPPEGKKLSLSNVDHTNQVVECAIAVAKVIEETQRIKINLDYLIAAAVLHDIDKPLLFHKATGQATRLGQLFAHTTLSAALALEEKLPLEIVHAIGSHSPNFSQVSPKTHEALILRYIDSMMILNWIMHKKISVSFTTNAG